MSFDTTLEIQHQDGEMTGIFVAGGGGNDLGRRSLLG